MLSDEVKKLEDELKGLKQVRLKALEVCKDLLAEGDLHPWVETKLKSLETFCRKGPVYTLHVDIDTDDDAMIEYKGKKYCFYGDDLIFSEGFCTLDGIAQYLLTEIIIPEGYKATHYVRQFIHDAALSIRNGTEMNFSTFGNQVMSINVTKNY